MTNEIENIKNSLEKVEHFLAGVVATRGYGQEAYDAICAALADLDRIKPQCVDMGVKEIITYIEKFLPCPFCGGTDIGYFGDICDGYGVTCGDCGGSTETFEGARGCYERTAKEKAVKAWNTRPALSQPKIPKPKSISLGSAYEGKITESEALDLIGAYIDSLNEIYQDHIPHAGEMVQPLPKGWMAVPVEPTAEMLSEASALRWTYPKNGSGLCFAMLDTIYKAMLAAAPKINEQNHFANAGKMVSAPKPEIGDVVCFSYRYHPILGDSHEIIGIVEGDYKGLHAGGRYLPLSGVTIIQKHTERKKP